MKSKLISQNGVLPLSKISTEEWWNFDKKSSSLVKGGAIATQSQCSSGGNGNGTCGANKISLREYENKS